MLTDRTPFTPRPRRIQHLSEKKSSAVAANGKDVAQICNLLYRRFLIGRQPDMCKAQKRSDDLQAGSPAIQQIGNLRYAFVNAPG